MRKGGGEGPHGYRAGRGVEVGAQCQCVHDVHLCTRQQRRVRMLSTTAMCCKCFPSAGAAAGNGDAAPARRMPCHDRRPYCTRCSAHTHAPVPQCANQVAQSSVCVGPARQHAAMGAHHAQQLLCPCRLAEASGWIIKLIGHRLEGDQPARRRTAGARTNTWACIPTLSAAGMIDDIELPQLYIML